MINTGTSPSDQRMPLDESYVLVGGYLRDYIESVEEAKKRIQEAETLTKVRP